MSSSLLETDGRRRIHLCLVNTTRARDLNRLPGVIYEEAAKFSEHVGEVRIVIFHNKLAKACICGTTFIHAVPIRLRENLIISGLSIVVNYFIMIPLIIWLILRYKINVVRADDILLTGLPATVACKITGKPVVVFVAGSLEDSLSHKLVASKVPSVIVNSVLKLSEKIEKFVMARSDHVFAVTSSLIKRATNYGAQNVSWSPTFLNFSLFKPLSNYRRISKSLRVLFVGRLEPEKGVNVLIKAAHILRNEEIEFKMVGDGSLHKKVEKVIEELNLKNVKLLGSKPHNEIYDIYSEADIFVLPSFTEGAPVAMLEAMVCGLPIIVTSVGIVPELIVNEVHAIVVPRGDASALATAIKKLAGDEELRTKIGDNGRELVLKKFKGYVEKHLKVYKSLVNKYSKTKD